MNRALIILLLIITKTEAQTSILAVADSLYATGNYTKAINQYAKTGNQKSGLQIARAYNAIGNYEKAIVQYQDLIEDNPLMQIAKFELGKLLVKTKDFDEARKLFSKLVSKEKGNPEYYYYLGEVYKELEQPASSIIAYKNAVDKDSTHLRSLFRLGKYFVVIREKNQALFFIEKGLEFYPEDIALINLKALALFNDSQFEHAIPWFEKLIELGEQKEYIYTKLAHCYYKNWNFEKAKNTYHILLDIDDTNEEAYFNLGHVFFKNKELDSAQYFIKKSIEVQEVSFEKEYASLGQIARAGNNLKLALDYYRLSHKEDPSNVVNYYQLCVLADQFYKDPKTKLKYYENLIKKYGTKQRYFSEFAIKRISELKEEIHFSKQ